MRIVSKIYGILSISKWQLSLCHLPPPGAGSRSNPGRRCRLDYRYCMVTTVVPVTVPVLTVAAV